MPPLDLQVEPVTKGYRITLTYELSVDGNALSAMPPTPVVDASATASIPGYAALRAALDDPKFLPQGAYAVCKMPFASHPHVSLRGLA